MKNSMKRNLSIFTIIALLLGFTLLSPIANAKDEICTSRCIYTTFPSWQTTAENPQELILDKDNPLVVGFRFEGETPVMYDVAIIEVDSKGNYLGGGLVYSSFNNIITEELARQGGSLLTIPADKFIKGHIYRMQLQAIYKDNGNDGKGVFNCFTYVKSYVK